MEKRLKIRLAGYQVDYLGNVFENIFLNFIF